MTALVLRSLKWKLFVVIVATFALGITGMTIQTYQAASRIPNVSPTIEALKVAFIMIGGLGVLLATYLNVWQSVETAKLMERQARSAQVENAFRLIEKWDDPALLAARDFTRGLKAIENQLSPDQLRKKIAEDAGLQRSVVHIFNYFDLLRISLQNERVTPEIIRDSLGNVFADIRDRLKPWIETRPEAVQRDIRALSVLLGEHN